MARPLTLIFQGILAVFAQFFAQMAEVPYQFSFLLPRRLALVVPPGRHQPCLAGCVLDVDRKSQRVTIEGPSRERVFDQVRRFAKQVGKGHGPLEISARLYSPPPIPGRLGGRDPYTILIGAEVAIVPTAMPCDIGLRPAVG